MNFSTTSLESLAGSTNTLVSAGLSDPSDPDSFVNSAADGLLDEVLDFEIDNTSLPHHLGSSITTPSSSTLAWLDNLVRLCNYENIS